MAIAFDLDGTPEVVIHNKTGILCPKGDVESVKAGIIKLIKDPKEAKRMGQLGKQFVQERWDWRYMVKTIEDDYERLIERNKLVSNERIRYSSNID